MSVLVQEQKVPPHPSLAGCTLTPWTWAMLHFCFHKAAARFGEEIGTFPSKMKVKIQKQNSNFYCSILLFPSVLTGCRGACPPSPGQIVRLQGPTSAWCQPQTECISPADLNTVLKAYKRFFSLLIQELGSWVSSWFDHWTDMFNDSNFSCREFWKPPRTLKVPWTFFPEKELVRQKDGVFLLLCSVVNPC